MKKISFLQLIVTIIGAAILWLIIGSHGALSFTVGSLLIAFAFISWGIGMTLIFQKKFIALSVGIIVFKYAILGVIIYWLVKQGWLQSVWFAIGVASFMISALVYAILESMKEDKQNVI